MGPVTKVLLLLALVVPVTAYVAGSLASPGAPPPADHSPVILRDAPADPQETPTPGTPSPAVPDPTRGDDREGRGERDDQQRDGAGRGGGEEARVVTPKPTPVGEDDDDDWDDDGPDDDDTDDDTDDGDD